jgi:hypothetical protein
MRIRTASSVTRSVLLPIFLLLASRFQMFAVVTTTVYNSFGPGNTYNSGIVWAVGGAAASGGYRGQAEYFVPGISGNLTTIQLATLQLGGSKLSNFFIAQDDGNGIPGTILESFLSVQNANGLMTINSATQPLLQAGQKYWLCDEPTADNSYNGWYQNSQGVANGFAFERSQWGWSFVGAPAPSSGVFSVAVAPVPEPSVAGLAVLGIGVLARRFRSARV